jgi:PKD repeat protein
MAIVKVQSKLGAYSANGVILDDDPTPGNLLLLWKAGHNDVIPILQSGFTLIANVENTTGNDRHGSLQYRIVESGDADNIATGASESGLQYYIEEWSGAELADTAAQNTQGSSTPFTCGGSVTPTTGLDSVVVGFAQIFQGSNEPTPTGIAPSASVTEDIDTSDSLIHDVMYVCHRAIASPSGSYTVGGTVSAGDARPISYCGVTVVLESTAGLAPVADFDYSPSLGVAPLTAEFTDTSTNTPTSWAWDFGDGDTSTSQNPSHVYDDVGIYSVTLTATNATGSDDVTKTAIIQVTADDGYEPPLPAGPLIEIYAAEAGAARWDIATWDDAVWSTAAWQDVTPQSVDAVIVWGSTRPELGILSKPSAGAWSITTYDPERLLDPANDESPYFGDIEPNLPVRVTHRGLVIRQGLAESIEYEYSTDIGRLRVYDNIAILANAQVPSDVDLSDTLYARAADAIAAAGLAVTVLPAPPSGDPAVYAWATGVNEWSAWQWITDAAEQVLHVPYIDRLGRLGFRAWDTPLARARTLDATNLIQLASLTQWNGLYSYVEAYDGATMQSAAVTPPPRYGRRIYTRDDPTVDAEAWAQAVLADRAFAALRWVPGELYPLTATDVEDFATIEAIELVGLSHAYTDPEVLANLIIVGGEIRITAKKEEEAKWWFTFEAAQTPLLPLVTEDESGFLMNESETEYLYPDV